MKQIAALICCLGFVYLLTANAAYAQSETRVKVLSWDKVAWNVKEDLKRGPIPTNRQPIPSDQEKTETNKRTPSKVPGKNAPTRTKPAPNTKPAPSRIPSSRRGEKTIPQKTPDYERTEPQTRPRPERNDRRPDEWERQDYPSDRDYERRGECPRGKGYGHGKGHGKGHYKGKHGNGKGYGNKKGNCENRPPRCGNEYGNGKGQYKKERYYERRNDGYSYRQGGGSCGTGYQ